MTDQPDNTNYNAPVNRTADPEVNDYFSGKKIGNFTLNSMDIFGQPPPLILPVSRSGDIAIAVTPTTGKIELPGLSLSVPDDKPGARIKVDIMSAESQIYTFNKESVVRLQGAGLRTDGLRNTGTGFFVDDKGLLVSDYHVTGGIGQTVDVRMSDGTTYKAKVVEIFAAKDLAALQLQNFKGLTKPVKLPDGPVAFKANEPVAALGFPNGTDELHISPGLYDAAAKLWEERIVNGYLPGEDPQRQIHRMHMDTRPGSSGSLVVSLKTGTIVGIQDFANEFGRTIVTPAQDVRALVDAVRAQRGESGTLADALLKSSPALVQPRIPTTTFDVRSSITLTVGKGSPEPFFLKAPPLK